MTEALDTTIGKVLTALDEEGLADNTLVLFFSDNGGPTGSGASNVPLRAGKGTAFEGGTRVPAVMRWPGKLKPGTTSQQVMSMMDYFPTLTAAVGIAPGNILPFDGNNLWPAITSGKVEPREDIFFSVGSGARQSLSVHHREWKLVRETSRSRRSEELSFPHRRRSEREDRSRREESRTGGGPGPAHRSLAQTPAGRGRSGRGGEAGLAGSEIVGGGRARLTANGVLPPSAAFRHRRRRCGYHRARAAIGRVCVIQRPVPPRGSFSVRPPASSKNGAPASSR